MNRINITEYDEETGSYRLIGWFDASRADQYHESTRWDGSHLISLATGSQWDHETLWRTAGGRWALQSWSQWQGSYPTWRYVSDDEARAWLTRNEHEEALARYWPAMPDEAGPSETPRRTIRISDELWAAIQERAAESHRTATDVILAAVRGSLALKVTLG